MWWKILESEEDQQFKLHVVLIKKKAFKKMDLNLLNVSNILTNAINGDIDAKINPAFIIIYINDR